MLDPKSWAGHTPGPWQMNGDGVVRHHFINDEGTFSDKNMPVKVGSGWKEGSWRDGRATPESLANASLMAAAPELAAENERLRAVLTEVLACFEAADAEGLQERLCETSMHPGALGDLVVRRLLYAHEAARAALTPESTS